MNSVIDKLNIAILTKDMRLSKDISLSLRKFNIYASVFVNLDEFLMSYNSRQFDLSFVDITCVKQGTLELKDFNKFKIEKMSVSLFYNSSSTSLVPSLSQDYVLKSKGFFNLDLDFENQFLNLRSIILSEMKLATTLSTVKSKVRHLSNQNLSLERESISFNETVNCYESFTGFLDGFKNNDDFLTKISKSLDAWKDCYKFSLLSYSENTKRLKSLNLSFDKYQNLPGMEISKLSILSENFFEMLSQAYSDQFSSNAKAISVSLDNHLILIGEFSSDLKEEKAWNYFSNSLSLISNDIFEVPIIKDESDFFSFLNDIDDQYFNKVKSDTKYMTIDLSPMTDFITTKYTSRFYWEEFIESFEASIKSASNPNSKIVRCASLSFFVGVDGLRLKESYDLLKKVIIDFKYWEFFEDKSIAFNSKSYPTLNLTSTSSAGIIRSLNNKSRINLSTGLMNQ